jgi:hypothetical protein
LAIMESRSSSVVKRVPATADQRKSLPAIPAAPGAPAQGTQPVMPGKTGLPAAPSAPAGKVPPPAAPAK